jgi:hypothetical protein
MDISASVRAVALCQEVRDASDKCNFRGDEQDVILALGLRHLR